VAEFKKARLSAKSVKSIVAHNSYLINLLTSNTPVRKQSVRYFIQVMNRCEALGVDALITHPGSHLGAGIEVGLRLTSDSLDEVMKTCAGFKTKILLENTAGQGDCLGHTFEELAEIVDKTTDPDRIGYCFDTQHAFASGYDIRSEELYEETFRKLDQTLGAKNVYAFHVNDALKEFGCRVDRHQSIGKGFIGKEPFRYLVNDHRFKKIPMCLETDPGDKMQNYKRELKLLRSLRTPPIVFA
jgi:deoxyribonuclease-4